MLKWILKNMLQLRTLLTLGILSTDQISKYLIKSYMMPGETIQLFSFLNLYLVYNKGITFGLLSNLRLQYYLVSLMVLGSFLILLYTYNISKKVSQSFQYPRLHDISYACSIGGGLGNIWDRISQSEVTDFIDFHISHWHFPTFNLADIALVLGFSVLCLLIWLKDTS